MKDIVKGKKSKCCNEEVELKARHGGEKHFEYCTKCRRRNYDEENNKKEY